MTFEALELWLDKQKESRIEYLEKLYAAHIVYASASSEALIKKEYEDTETKAYDSVARKRITKNVKALVVMVEGKKYLSNTFLPPAELQYLSDCGLGEISNGDMQLIKYYTRDERLKRVDKEIDSKRKSIIAHVKKICTEEIIGVSQVAGDGIFIKGANGKTAHMWAIFAGGYNIQCLHLRVMVKEAAWL